MPTHYKLLAEASPAGIDSTTTAGRYTLNSGTGLVIDVNRKTGDVVSILYNDRQLQDKTKSSQIGSGLGTAQVSYQEYEGQYFKVTCSTPTLTHYYMMKKGVNAIFMATYTTAEPSIESSRTLPA